MKCYWILVCLALSNSAQAHHTFDEDVLPHLVQFGGTITGLEWAEPHVLVRVSLDPFNSSMPHWLVELDSPGELMDRGIDIRTFEVFNHISFIAYPSKKIGCKRGCYSYGLYLVPESHNKVLLNQVLFNVLMSMEGPIPLSVP